MSRLTVAVLLILVLLVACAHPAAAPGAQDDNAIEPEHVGSDAGGGNM